MERIGERELGVRREAPWNACYYAAGLGPQLVSSISGAGVKVVEAGRLRDLKRRKDRALRGRELAALGDGSLVVAMVTRCSRSELVAQVPPSVVCADLGDAAQQKGQPAELDMRADAVLCDDGRRTQVDRRLQVPPAALGLVEGLVAERDLLGREPFVGAPEEELAIEVRLLAD